ncbi:putative target of rapamycin (TOR) kinase 1 [Leptomonas pyrrhocoris]|uniref:Putative target of rapamycin (TOR) kinase 1 n=1 Tax=Leptomonas pyrrhocoris TaxID=157538 RepID=A0A0N0DSN6_LEPPY|nr:putative target of rapamycin (TOR) kinase 1 [Leptomonas pyrrhocoris]KPA76342.1 putative target of rapamycin (TOR) kinase 1 [Leptomonas pyrrhocoris]|eukprot:XP_015654781.1 putative target of rapamycin (TOR) kinase 1 [Leptomonas pyrrhocoris]
MRHRVRKRFDALTALLSEEPRDSRPSRWTVPMDDATRPLEARIIEKAPDADTRGWIHPFSVVEEKPSDKRRRWIAWPREKNEQDLLETQLDDLRHTSEYMSIVHGECATRIFLVFDGLSLHLSLVTEDSSRLLGFGGIDLFIGDCG